MSEWKGDAVEILEFVRLEINCKKNTCKVALIMNLLLDQSSLYFFHDLLIKMNQELHALITSLLYEQH